MPDQNQHLLALSAQIVAAHTGNNHVGIEALPDMIRSVYKTLADLDLPRSQILVVTNRAQADPGQADHRGRMATAAKVRREGQGGHHRGGAQGRSGGGAQEIIRRPPGLSPRFF